MFGKSIEWNQLLIVCVNDVSIFDSRIDQLNITSGQRLQIIYSIHY